MTIIFDKSRYQLVDRIRHTHFFYLRVIFLTSLPLDMERA